MTLKKWVIAVNNTLTVKKGNRYLVQLQGNNVKVLIGQDGRRIGRSMRADNFREIGRERKILGKIPGLDRARRKYG